jgi:hypothetical protein
MWSRADIPQARRRPHYGAWTSLRVCDNGPWLAMADSTVLLVATVSESRLCSATSPSEKSRFLRTSLCCKSRMMRGTADLASYVEQEIVGDDTTALDSVLQADVWRHKLITEEKELTARLDELEKVSATPQDGAAPADETVEAEKDDITTRIGDIQKKLVDMEAETGPSRASALLAGLGFNDADQKLPTKAFSGGWRMRLALARALFVKPDVGYRIQGVRADGVAASHAR